MESNQYTCMICGNTSANTTYQLKEMMFGTGETFPYFQCGACGCLQIAHFPPDMNAHYPENYYSFNERPPFKKSTISRFLAYHRTRHFLFGRNPLGAVLGAVHDNPVLRGIGKTGISPESRVLDVGCGTGHILYNLSLAGMKNILGIDPFLQKSIYYDIGLRIEKMELAEVDGGWDLIMLNHVFEHMKEQQAVLRLIHEKLNDGGLCLIRVPTCSSEAWETYRGDWVQADPPRHFFIHSHKSIKLLADSSGFDVERIECDSTAFQFWGSELYKMGIPLMDKKSLLIDPNSTIFPASKLRAYEQKARSLNTELRGDQMAVFLKKRAAS